MVILIIENLIGVASYVASQQNSAWFSSLLSHFALADTLVAKLLFQSLLRIE